MRQTSNSLAQPSQTTAKKIMKSQQNEITEAITLTCIGIILIIAAGYSIVTINQIYHSLTDESQLLFFIGTIPIAYQFAKITISEPIQYQDIDEPHITTTQQPKTNPNQSTHKKTTTNETVTIPKPTRPKTSQPIIVSPVTYTNPPPKPITHPDPDVERVLRIQQEREQQAIQRIQAMPREAIPPRPYDRKRPAELTTHTTKSEQNQAELDRYINYMKNCQDPVEIGKFYERYIGYLLENKGFKVYYNGIQHGKQDLGIDLIATKNNTVRLIQTKYWSKSKTIYDNIITQLHGSATLYAKTRAKPHQKIQAVLITSTTLDPQTKQNAQTLGIYCLENQPFQRDYPMIKCKINRETGEKIYHLPTDQQYDIATINPTKGEMYAHTIFQAEFHGFRRAHRWNNNQRKS